MTMARRAQRGFTLIEVLVASVLMASVFVAAVSLMSQSLRNLHRMEPHERALLHAREKMTEELLREQLTLEHASGQWDDGYRWQVDIAPKQIANVTPLPGGYGMFDVRVQIAWGDARQPRAYEVATTQWAQLRPEKTQ